MGGIVVEAEEETTTSETARAGGESEGRLEVLFVILTARTDVRKTSGAEGQ